MEFLKSVLFDRSFPTRERELNESVDFNRPIAFKIELEGLTRAEYNELRNSDLFERCFVRALKQTMGYVCGIYDNNTKTVKNGMVNETGVVIEETGVIIIRPKQRAYMNLFYNNVMHLSSCISSVFTRALQSVASPFEHIICNSVIVTQITYLNSNDSDYDAEEYVTYVYNQHWDPQNDETMPNIYFIKPTEVEEGEVIEEYTVRDGVYTDWLEIINTDSLERRHTDETDEDNDGDYIPSSDSNED